MLRLATFLLLAAVFTGSDPVSLTAKDLAGKDDSLDHYRGQVVVLNFWATWCVPCKDEMKLFRAAHEQYAGKGLAVIAASLDDPKDHKEIEKFVKKQKMTMTVWQGVTPEILEKTTWSPALPATLFLDRDGRQVFRVVGQIREKELQERIDWLLSDRAAAAPAADVDHFKE